MVTFSAEVLRAYVAGELDAETASEVAAAASGDSVLAGTIDWFRWLCADARFAVERPPASLRARLVALFDDHPGGARDLDAEWVAALSYDSGVDALAGVRGGGGGGDLRRLVFASEMADVVVDLVRARDSTRRIDGQLFVHAGGDSVVAGRVVGATEASPAECSATIEPGGRFAIDGPPRALRWIVVITERFRLRLDLPNDSTSG